MAISTLVLAVAFYAAVATGYAEARRRREAPPTWARIAGPGSVAVHLAGLVVLSAEMERSPFATSSQSLSFVAFSLVGLYLLLEATSRVATHGGWFYAAAALLAALSVPGLVEADAVGAVAPPKDPSRSLHIGLALLSTAAVLAGGILAIGYLDAYRRVKTRTLGSGTHGPSLHGFERLARRASLLGAALLAASLVMGLRLQVVGGEPAGMLYLVATTAGLLALLAAAFLIWWLRPLRGVVASWLLLGAAIFLLVAFAVVHPLALRGLP